MTVTGNTITIPEFDLADRCIKARKVGRYKRQEDLAAASGISVRTISRYENGETTKPNRSIMRQWALSCGVPFDWLMGDGFTTRGNGTSRNRKASRPNRTGSGRGRLGGTRPGGARTPALAAA